LFVAKDAPSSVKSDTIKENQLDDKYYSPCANTFMLTAHILAFKDLPPPQSSQLREQFNQTYSDLTAAMESSETLGYCSQVLREEGVTALFAANISKCFHTFCSEKGNSETEKRVSIMHQSGLEIPGKGTSCEMDISLFYRFIQSDIFKSDALFPFLFFEFTKTKTKSIEEKLPQASLYANYLFRLMKIERQNPWVPLLGVVMSEYEMLFRVYSLSVVGSNWKIAEVNVMRCTVSPENLHRLMHIMLGWTLHCRDFLFCPRVPPFLQHGSNVVEMGGKVFKCYDYTEMSRGFVQLTDRRSPDPYLRLNSTFLDATLELNWNSSSDPNKALQIISYTKIQGSHCPSVVGHITSLVSRMEVLHQSGYVHGDLRFLNVVFSTELNPPKATLIDFDYSGPEGEKRYPPRFNLDIPDGSRHCDAQPGALLNKTHDVAAMQWMCGVLQPKKENLRENWKSRILNLDFADFSQDNLLEELELVNLSDLTSGSKGTGSPPMKLKTRVH
jgi:hypothetical protein